MNKQSNVNVRLDDEAREALSALRRLSEPIPTASSVMREALMEKFERDAKPNGHSGRTVKPGKG